MRPSAKRYGPDEHGNRSVPDRVAGAVHKTAKTVKKILGLGSEVCPLLNKHMGTEKPCLRMAGGIVPWSSEQGTLSLLALPPGAS